MYPAFSQAPDIRSIPQINWFWLINDSYNLAKHLRIMILVDYLDSRKNSMYSEENTVLFICTRFRKGLRWPAPLNNLLIYLRYAVWQYLYGCCVLFLRVYPPVPPLHIYTFTSLISLVIGKNGIKRLEENNLSVLCDS